MSLWSSAWTLCNTSYEAYVRWPVCFQQRNGSANLLEHNAYWSITLLEKLVIAQLVMSFLAGNWYGVLSLLRSWILVEWCKVIIRGACCLHLQCVTFPSIYLLFSQGPVTGPCRGIRESNRHHNALNFQCPF